MTAYPARIESNKHFLRFQLKNALFSMIYLAYKSTDFLVLYKYKVDPKRTYADNSINKSRE